MNISTGFPASGTVSAVIGGGAFFAGNILFRIPCYADGFNVFSGGEKVPYLTDAAYPGYAIVPGPFSEGMVFEIAFNIEDRMVLSEGSVNSAGNGLAILEHGPVVMARDRRDADIRGPVRYCEKPELTVTDNPYASLYSCSYGGYGWIDYASAGATWDGSSEFTTWFGPARS